MDSLLNCASCMDLLTFATTISAFIFSMHWLKHDCCVWAYFYAALGQFQLKCQSCFAVCLELSWECCLHSMMNFGVIYQLSKPGFDFFDAVTEVALMSILWNFFLNWGEENLAFSLRSPLELLIWILFCCIVRLGEESSWCTTDTFPSALMSCLCRLRD